MSDIPMKVIVSPDGHKYVPLSAKEIADLEATRVKFDAEQAAREAEEARIATLKASAKAKLIAGEKLTEEEASLLIG